MFINQNISPASKQFNVFSGIIALCVAMAFLVGRSDAEYPEFISSRYSPIYTSYYFTVVDKSEAGTIVGKLYISSSGYSPRSIIFGFCSGNTNDDFTITSYSSQIGTLEVANTMDMATRPRYEMIITASDGTVKVQTTVTIYVVVRGGATSLFPMYLMTLLMLLLHYQFYFV